MMPCENICNTAPAAPGIRRRQPEQHETHVADAGVPDHELEILLHQRHQRAIAQSRSTASSRERDIARPHCFAAPSGNQRHATRSAPYAPSFITTPASSIEAAVGAAT
jgi:hypothetical protein